MCIRDSIYGTPLINFKFNKKNNIPFLSNNTGSRVEEIEQERERKKRELFKQMNEERLAAERAENESKGDAVNGGENKKGESLERDSNETSPPGGRGKGSDIASLEDDDALRRRKRSDEDDSGVDFDSLETTKKDAVDINNNAKSGVKIANLEDDDTGRRRRNKYDDGGEDYGKKAEDSDSSPVSSPEPSKGSKDKTNKDAKKDDKDWRSEIGKVKIASLDDSEESKGPVRRRKDPMFNEKEDEEERLATQKQKEREAEEKRIAEEEALKREEVERKEAEKKRKADEERANRSELDERKKKLSRDGGKTIVANLDTEDPAPRRRRRK